MTVDMVRTPERAAHQTAPERSLEQRLGALDKANEIRIRRARFKRDIKAGYLEVVDYIAAPTDWLETMKVWDLLLAMPKTGRVKASRILRDVHMSQSKTLGGLSPRQRTELVMLLSHR